MTTRTSSSTPTNNQIKFTQKTTEHVLNTPKHDQPTITTNYKYKRYISETSISAKSINANNTPPTSIYTNKSDKKINKKSSWSNSFSQVDSIKSDNPLKTN